MDAIIEALHFKLVSFTNPQFNVAPINLILIGLIILLYFISRKLIWKSINKVGDKSDRVAQKSDTIYRLLKQALFFICLILVVQSFNVNNDHINFGSFLQLNLTANYNGFQISVYHIFLALAIFFIVRFGLNIFKLYLHKVFEKRDWVDEGKEFTIFQLVKYFVYTIALITLVKSTGVDMDILINSAAAFIVAIGLGLQTIFADFVSGIILLFEGTVKVGDVLLINGEVSKVQMIHIRTSKVKTLDGEIIIVPNSKLTSENVVNWSHTDKSTRFIIQVGVAYGTDTRVVEQLLIDATKVCKQLSKRKKPRVFFKDFGDSALIFELTFWGERSFELEDAKSNVRFEIDRLFRENGIKIPFPQREVLMRNEG